MVRKKMMAQEKPPRLPDKAAKPNAETTDDSFAAFTEELIAEQVPIYSTFPAHPDPSASELRRIVPAFPNSKKAVNTAQPKGAPAKPPASKKASPPPPIAPEPSLKSCFGGCARGKHLETEMAYCVNSSCSRPICRNKKLCKECTRSGVSPTAMQKEQNEEVNLPIPRFTGQVTPKAIAYPPSVFSKPTNQIASKPSTAKPKAKPKTATAAEPEAEAEAEAEATPETESAIDVVSADEEEDGEDEKTREGVKEMSRALSESGSSAVQNIFKRYHEKDSHLKAYHHRKKFRVHERDMMDQHYVALAKAGREYTEAGRQLEAFANQQHERIQQLNEETKMEADYLSTWDFEAIDREIHPKIEAMVAKIGEQEAAYHNSTAYLAFFGRAAGAVPLSGS